MPSVGTYLHGFAVAAAIPIRIHDLDILVPDALLFFEPGFSKVLSFQAVLFVTLPVGQERSVDSRVFGEPDPYRSF